jgi:uncharacterized protein with PIN domain
MVIDTSALVAIFLGEPERQQFLEAITQSLAKFFNEPLLAKGNDFIQTDITVY